MEIAALEIARMSEEIDGLRAELLAEQERRLELEAHYETLQSSFEDALVEKEVEVREECWNEMESKLEAEMRRWKATWAEEGERNDEHLDKKLEILGRATNLDQDEDKENTPVRTTKKDEDFESENARLRLEVEVLTRQLQGRSPSKRGTKGGGGPLRDISGQMGGLRVSGESIISNGSGNGSPVKRVRKLTARKWDLGDEGELL